MVITGPLTRNLICEWHGLFKEKYDGLNEKLNTTRYGKTEVACSKARKRPNESETSPGFPPSKEGQLI